MVPVPVLNSYLAISPVSTRVPPLSTTPSYIDMAFDTIQFGSICVTGTWPAKASIACSICAAAVSQLPLQQLWNSYLRRT